jgi:hypothetical protein
VINVASIIAAGEVAEQVTNQNQSLDALIESLGDDVPDENSSSIEIRRYYETHSNTFTQLQQVVDDNETATDPSHEFTLKSRAEEALEKLDTLKENYGAIRAGYITTLNELQTKLDSIPSTDINEESYKAAIIELHNISGEFENVS